MNSCKFKRKNYERIRKAVFKAFLIQLPLESLESVCEQVERQIFLCERKVQFRIEV
jgi:hypothetical protein